ncbi:MAG: sulfatase-like hydrolase/transferase [Candidatus Latescibacteria bacterium]|nr:sulfatase-like hydrolase/transferase [Candidatus Latescibacterota bacterium]
MPPTNLLFITTDQQRWDSLPCYGLDFMQTPHLDRLAQEGQVFDHCYVASPVCVPCRAAMLSGRWPTATGVLGNGAWLPDDMPTWPGLFSAAGYRTAAIGKMHFDPWAAMGGFDERIMAEDKRHVYLPDDHVKYLRQHGLERAHPTENPGYFEWLGASVTPLEKRFHVDGFTGDRGAEWLRAHGDKPFAAWVSFAGPHDPYDPPEEMASMYYDAPIPKPVGARDELAEKPKAQLTAGDSRKNSMFRLDMRDATPEQVRRWRAHYYANISLIDEGIGKMLQALEEHGVLDNTLIVFTSDHGDALGDHGMSFKGFFYDSMARVPLIARGPGVEAGVRSGGLVGTLDLVPLFYQACGVTPPPGLQGGNLGALFEDPQATIHQRVFSEILGRTMVRDQRYKYVYYASGEAELYDMQEDPDEICNLAGREIDVENRLRGYLLEHMLANHRPLAQAVARPQHPYRVALEEAYAQGRDKRV